MAWLCIAYRPPPKLFRVPLYSISGFSPDVACLLEGGTCGSPEGAFDVTLNNSLQLSFFGTVYIGTPPQAFAVNFDTSSATLFVASATCEASPDCDDITKFNAVPAIAVSHNASSLLGFLQGLSSSYEFQGITATMSIGDAVATVRVQLQRSLLTNVLICW